MNLVSRVKVLIEERDLLLRQLAVLERTEAIVLRQLQSVAEAADRSMFKMQLLSDLLPLAGLFKGLAKSYSEVPKKLSNFRRADQAIKQIHETGGTATRAQAGRKGGTKAALNLVRQTAARDSSEKIAEEVGVDAVGLGYDRANVSSDEKGWLRGQLTKIWDTARNLIEPESESGYRELPIHRGFASQFKTEYASSTKAIDRALNEPTSENIHVAFGEFFRWYGILTDLSRAVEMGYGQYQYMLSEARMSFMKASAKQKNAVRARVLVIECEIAL